MRVKVLSRNPDDYVRETKLDLQRGEQHPRSPRLSPSPDPFSPPGALLRPRGGGSERPGPAWQHREAPGLAAAPRPLARCPPGSPRCPPGPPPRCAADKMAAAACCPGRGWPRSSSPGSLVVVSFFFFSP